MKKPLQDVNNGTSSHSKSDLKTQIKFKQIRQKKMKLFQILIRLVCERRSLNF